MNNNPRQVQIWDIVEKDLPDTIGITAIEYFFAGWEYESGFYIGTPDLSLAIKCYEKAVTMGDTKAMIALAKLYARNDDPENAYRWYLEAALTVDDAEAIAKIGEMYFEGEYVRADLERAYRYFRVAYEKGEPKAMYYLGLYAEQGILGAPDLDKARKLYLEGTAKYEKACMERLSALDDR